MIKNEIQKIKNNIKQEYKRLKRKRIKASPVILIIILLALAVFQSGKENETLTKQHQAANEQTTKTLQNVRDEIKSIRNEATSSSKKADDRLKQLDNKIEGIKVSKAKATEEKIRLANQPTRSVASLGSGDINGSILRYFGANARLAQAVFTAESGLRQTAVSPTGDYGIAQINLASHWSQIKGSTAQEKIDALFDVDYNLQMAVAISSNGTNWNPWTQFKTGAYLRYL